MLKRNSGAGGSAVRKNSRIIKVTATVLLFALAVYSFSYMLTAKNTYIITDGDTVLVHESYEDDAEAVIAEAGISLDYGDAYVSEAGGDGVSEIVIERAKTVSLNYKGAYSVVTTRCVTVGELLESAGISLGENEVMDCLPGDAVYDGMTIGVTSLEISCEAFTEEIPFDTIAIANENMEINTLRYIQEGSPGIKTVTYETVIENGMETRTAESEEIISEPVNAVIEYGTKAPAAQETEKGAAPGSSEVGAGSGSNASTGSQTSTSGSLSVAGNPESTDTAEKSVSGGGSITTASGEVITYTKVINVKATAYTTDGSSTTATGTAPGVGTVSVDPDVIPYGTKLYIMAEDGSWVYGYAVAEDCGSFTGNRIDIYFDTYNDCIKFGRQNATVYILG